MEAHPPCLLPKGLHPSGHPLPRRHRIVIARSAARGSPEGHSPTGGRYGGCAARPRGSPEGHRPNGRRSGGCASIKQSSFLYPLPRRKGARGMVPPLTDKHPASRYGGCASKVKGESRGAQPPWQESEDVPPGGYPQGAPLRCPPSRSRGSPEGDAPLAGGMEDVPP